MKLIVLTAITATISAQIQLFHPDGTAILIDNTPDCYNIFPAIDEVTDTNGLKLEFYKHSNCAGQKIEEFSGDSILNAPVHAYSVKVSDNRRRYKHLLADWNDKEDYFEDEGDDFDYSEDYLQDEDGEFDPNQGIFDFEKNGIDWSQATVEADEDGIVRGVNTEHHGKEQDAAHKKGCNPFAKVFWGC